MARNFLDEDDRRAGGVGYTDGFRFGFGFFIANLVGLTLIGTLEAAVNWALGRLH